MNPLKFTALAVSGIFSTQMQAQNTPNVVIILLDDMGYGDLSITGATGYTTPNLDRMCNEGMFFTHYYAPQAVSSASGLRDGRAPVMFPCATP